VNADIEDMANKPVIRTILTVRMFPDARIIHSPFVTQYGGICNDRIEECPSKREGMERFDVRRGMIKQIVEEGGLSVLAGKYFEDIRSGDDTSFIGSHGIMTLISGKFEGNALIIDVTNVAPDFDDPEAMKSAMDARRRWTTFLDDATGYNSKQRGDKAKEWAKKATKAKSAVSSARHFMSMSDSLSPEKIEEAEGLISEIEAAIESNENTKAAGRAEKLKKLFN